jgi:hypothetical protein
VVGLFYNRWCRSKSATITSFQMLKDGAYLLPRPDLLTSYLRDSVHNLLCQLLPFLARGIGRLMKGTRLWNDVIWRREDRVRRLVPFNLEGQAMRTSAAVNGLCQVGVVDLELQGLSPH